MSYSTQMDAAQKGILTRHMKDVLSYEHISEEVLIEGLSKGSIVLPANKNHTHLVGCAVGKNLRTKINVNIGVSKDCCDMDLELQKAKTAIGLKADAIMDLSTYGATLMFRRKLIEVSPLMIGTVPIYDAAGTSKKAVKDLSIDDFFQVVEAHAKDGVDFMTIHAGLTRRCVEGMKKKNRLTHVVSRGGAILLEWMEKNDAENPFYEHFDRLLQILRSHDVTLSLGDGLRPGSLNDSTDSAQIQELINLGELTKAAWEEKVQVIIEGPGHVPLNEIITNMQLEKKLCHGAPFYVLGPLVTDVAPGYDHITSAIGGAIAAANGADFLCYVTPAEHLRLPDLKDMKEGIIASRIAAHAADVAKGYPNAMEWDNAMSKARRDLNWEKMYSLAIDPDKAREYRQSSQPEDKDVCTMCGELCAIKKSGAIFS